MRMKKLTQLGIIPDNMPASEKLLSDRPWSSLNEDEKRFSSKLMEIYAAMVSDIDHHVGRLIDYLEPSGKLENTIIFFMSDNGAEGYPLDQSFSNMALNNM